MYTFTFVLWLRQGNGGIPWTVITVPRDVSEEIGDAEPLKGGFGSVKVDVTIADTDWCTSPFPSTEHDSYIFPVEKLVRVRESLHHGD